MKKLITLTVLIVSIANFTSSCEVDDICIEEVLTPRLIIRFYDAVKTDSIAKVQNLSVWAEDKDTLYTMAARDSIALPFDIHNTNTTYLLKKGNDIDVLELFHDNNSVYVSRSCGYKYNFTLQETSNTTHNWIATEELNTPQNIENEQKAHIKIYH